MSDIAMRCPHCGRTNDGHECVTAPTRAQPGDVAICWGCRRVAIFAHDPSGRLFQRIPTRAEQVEIEAEPDVRRALAAMAEAYTPLQAVALMREQGAQ